MQRAGANYKLRLVIRDMTLTSSQHTYAHFERILKQKPRRIRWEAGSLKEGLVSGDHQGEIRKGIAWLASTIRQGAKDI